VFRNSGFRFCGKNTRQNKEQEPVMTALKIVSASVALVASVAILGGPAALQAKPMSYKLPEETAAFKPGPNLDVVQNNCTACHSADYIKTQPRGPKFKKDFWQAEVTKMIKVYGAPIDDADVGKIVDYLAQTY
jgi:mono/diheme cytochrome c family protein